MGAQSFMPIQVRDTLGVARSLPIRPRKPRCFVFLAVTVRSANRYAPEIKRIESTYGKKGIRLCSCLPRPRPALQRRSSGIRSPWVRVPAILDTKLALAASTGATVTPEVAVLGKDGSLLYLGTHRRLQRGAWPRAAQLSPRPQGGARSDPRRQSSLRAPSRGDWLLHSEGADFCACRRRTAPPHA